MEVILYLADMIVEFNVGIQKQAKSLIL